MFEELNHLTQRLLNRKMPVEEAVCEWLELIEETGAEEGFEQLRVDEVLGRAKGLDRSLLEGSTPGPLHGVPFVVDSTVAIARRTAGVIRMQRSLHLGADAACVSLLRQSGALLLGRRQEGAHEIPVPLSLGTRPGHGSTLLVPTQGAVSPEGLENRRPTTQTLELRAVCLGVLEGAALALRCPGLPAEPSRSLRLGFAGLDDEVMDKLEMQGHRVQEVALGSLVEIKELVNLVAQEEIRVAELALPTDGQDDLFGAGVPCTSHRNGDGPAGAVTASELREALDGAARLRAELELEIKGLDATLLAGETRPIAGLHLPSVGAADRLWTARRFEDGRLLHAVRRVEASLEGS